MTMTSTLRQPAVAKLIYLTARSLLGLLTSVAPSVVVVVNVIVSAMSRRGLVGLAWAWPGIVYAHILA